MKDVELIKQDLFFISLKLLSIINYKSVNEFFERGLISSHRELSPEHKDELLRKAESVDLTSRTREQFHNIFKSLDEINKYSALLLEKCNSRGISVVGEGDDEYPVSWKQIGGMPKVFFAKGILSVLGNLNHKGAVSIVGSRDPSKYALCATEKYSKELSKKEVTIVSGMAYGIDRQAHEEAVKYPGSTIAVLAGGVDSVYPSGNQDLYDSIIRNGLVISEMPPGQRAIKQYFPARNRLIAGLGDACLIMEAGEHSGTLHTASYAASMNREVFVLPNNIFYSNAIGGMNLLSDGAQVLYNLDYVVDSVVSRLLARDYVYVPEDDEGSLMLLHSKAVRCPEELSSTEWKRLISDYLMHMEMSADALAAKIELPFYRLSVLLTEMEAEGKVFYKGGKYALTFV